MKSTKENQNNIIEQDNIIEQENDAKKTERLEGLKALLDDAIHKSIESQRGEWKEIMTMLNEEANIKVELYKKMSNFYNKDTIDFMSSDITSILKSKKEDIEKAPQGLERDVALNFINNYPYAVEIMEKSRKNKEWGDKRYKAWLFDVPKTNIQKLNEIIKIQEQSNGNGKFADREKNKKDTNKGKCRSVCNIF